MGRRATCFDNAVAESFFATYKKELIHIRPRQPRADADNLARPHLLHYRDHGACRMVQHCAAWQATPSCRGHRPTPAPWGAPQCRVTDRGGSFRRWRRVHVLTLGENLRRG